MRLKIDKNKIAFLHDLNEKVQYKRHGPGHECNSMASLQNGDYNMRQREISKTSHFALKQSPFFFKNP